MAGSRATSKRKKTLSVHLRWSKVGKVKSIRKEKVNMKR